MVYELLAANHPFTPTETFTQLTEYKNASAHNSSVSVKKSKELDKSRESVARNTNTPPEVLTQLAEEAGVWVCALVAANTSTPPETLTKLTENKNSWVRASVAHNFRTPPETLAQLAEDEDLWVRCKVAANSSTPIEVLTKLAEDEVWDVRCEVAQNNSTTRELLKFLVEDESLEVQMGVVTNSSTSPETLKRAFFLSKTWNPAVSMSSMYLDDEFEVVIHEGIATNPSTPLEVLLELVKSEHDKVKTVAARNPVFLQYRAVQDSICEAGVLMPVEWLKQMYLT